MAINSTEMMLMMNKTFLDTNVLLYMYATDEPIKHTIAKTLLEKHEHIVISTQVLFEFSNIMHKKLKQDYDTIEAALEEFHSIFDIAIIRYQTIVQALKTTTKYKYSFPDSLIVATALEYDCNLLLSEDMHHNQMIQSNLRIVNPFLDNLK
jgi:predicted nucleic acid-binding protein